MTTDKIRKALNILFLIGAAAAIITYFVADYRTFIYICAAAVFFKVLEFIIRFTN
ncbi:hypothetical protein [Bacteroides propionicifaciens]|uniref:hypothetical protein n=1 Tax=Bacteroides propionicifaciens TaxID=392838 RepID=UPI00036BACA3|nr:hypothetical protein [Bacteroides propionicifaciens]